MLLQILEVIRDEIRNGTPLVGLETSCVSVFRDEMCDLLPFNEDAKRLKKQTYTLAEFLKQKASHYKAPLLKGKAIVQGHCHQKAIMKMKSEEKLFDDSGMEYEMLDSGCCGMDHLHDLDLYQVGAWTHKKYILRYSQKKIAAGEITKEEYQEAKRVLEDKFQKVAEENKH